MNGLAFPMRVLPRLLPALRTVSLMAALPVMVLLAWALLAGAPGAWAQGGAPAPWNGLAGPLFSHIGQAEGLPYPVALAMAQDREGFLWIGTPGGLARWDGYRMRVFRHHSGDSDTLPDNIVSSLLADERGRLWVGILSGSVARFDPERQAFVTHRDPNGAAGRMRGMASDGNGGLWTIGTNGLAHLDTASGRWRRDEPAELGLPPGEFQAIHRDRTGTLWLGTPQGLMRRAPGDGRFLAVPAPGETDAVVPTALFEDGAGRLWVGTAIGQLGMVDDATGAVRLLHAFVPSGQRVSAIVEPTPGTLWISEFGGGVRELRTATGTIRAIRHDPQDPTSLTDDSVTDMLIDRSGLVWMSTSRGVDRHNPVDHGLLTVLPSAPNGLLGKDVRSMSARPDGKVWLGFRNEGIALIDPVNGRVAEMRPGPARGRGLPRQMVQAIAALSNGDVWTGSRLGLHRAVPAIGRVHTFLPLHGSNIMVLMAEEPVLWAGGGMGLARIGLDDDSLHVFANAPDRPDSLSDNSVQALLRDGKGRLWVGTQRGLNLFDAGTGTFHRFLHDPDDPESLPSDIATTLLEDDQGRLWVGTGNGIGILEPDAGGKPRFRRLGTAQGLPHDTITKILEDRDGTIWVVGGDRLAMVDPRTLSVRTFGLVEGAGIRTHWVGSGARLPDGTLLFGGFGGLTVVRPRIQPEWNFRPPVVITEVRVGGRMVPAPAGDTPIVVPADNRHVEVEFAALDHSEPQRNRYAYRLEGFDRDWISDDANHRTATYTGLSPGSYTLLVRGSNREGVWSEPPLRVAVTVLPAWYQTTGFQIAVVLATATLVLALFQGRTAILRRRQRELERQVALRTAEVEAARARAIAGEASARRAKEEAEAADRAKSRFLAVISHEIRTPLNGVLGMLQMLDAQGLDKEQGRRIEIAKRSGDTLVSLIESILEYGRYEAGGARVTLGDVDPRRLADAALDLFRPQAGAKGVRLDLEISRRVPALVRCDQVQITRILHNLLGNALKFTDAGRIGLSVDTAPEDGEGRTTLRFAVTDSGIGIAPDLHAAIFEDFVQADDSIARRFGGTGLGLAISRRIATLLGGSLTVESAVGTGSTFRLAVPVEMVAVAVAVADGPAAGPAPSDGGALTALLVDDDPVNREVGAGLLGRLGHRVTVAADGPSAIDAAAGEVFDLVLMDLHMPGIDGIETIQRLRSLPNTPAAGWRLMVMTADVTESTRRRCAEAGVETILSKPLHLAALREALAAIGRGLAGDTPPPPGGSDPAGCLDLAFLADQWDTVGTAELVRLTRLFARASRRTIADLDAAVAAGDQTAARALAHRMRSAAGVLGMVALERAAAAIEKAEVGTGAKGGAGADAAQVEGLRRLRRVSLDALFAAARGAGRGQDTPSTFMPSL
ncbi:MAG TPA: two-component regulator propeller domain-containing protein [Azospirillum sp.]|nr:two-component regulator propeller domain-containing protein [Azospirillum sp.]